ncbi:hypothetical protein F2Q69_00023391 [Brassica cretica]|uniref:Uncharacterized protein n=1 Tax=Brassica cretica TaxID=69181 RepID=A0A8S9QGK2_BRACR|nr:hypothetical protein F2Q69_00023391 [Brassica cretica]
MDHRRHPIHCCEAAPIKAPSHHQAPSKSAPLSPFSTLTCVCFFTSDLASQPSVHSTVASSSRSFWLPYSSSIQLHRERSSNNVQVPYFYTYGPLSLRYLQFDPKIL